MPPATGSQQLFLGHLNDALTQNQRAIGLEPMMGQYSLFRSLFHTIISSNMVMWQTQLRAMTTEYGGAECITRFLLYEQLFLAQCVTQVSLQLFQALQIPPELWPLRINMVDMFTRINNVYLNQEVYGELTTLRASAALAVWHYSVPWHAVTTIHHVNVPLVFLLLPKDVLQTCYEYTPYSLQDGMEYNMLKTYKEQIYPHVQTYFATLPVCTDVCGITVLQDTRSMLQLYWAMIKQQHAPLSMSLSIARYMGLSLIKSPDQTRLLAVACKAHDDDDTQRAQNHQRVQQAHTQLASMHFMFAGLNTLYSMWLR